MNLAKVMPSEVDIIISLENDPENSPFIFPNTKEEHLQLMADNDVAHMWLKTDEGRTVGYVMLAGLINKWGNIELRRVVIQYKGKGYGRAAIREIKRHCFAELNCHRLWLDVLESNERARSLYETEGFVQEGLLRDYVFIDGSYHNLVIMSLLENEY